MNHLKWTGAEKKIARTAFDAALNSVLANVMAEFKAKANAVTKPSEMWVLEDYLRERGRQINEKFDYRYSQLPLVFARLIRDGDLNEASLAGLSEEKLNDIRRHLSWMKRK